MVVREVVSACGCHRLELVIWKPVPKMPTGGRQRIVEHIIRIVHPINPVHSLQAALVEAAVMGDERKVPDERRGFLPDFGEERGILGVIRAESVDLHAEPLVVLRLRMDEAVEGVCDKTAADDHQPHAADARGLLVRRFEIDSAKVSHFP